MKTVDAYVVVPRSAWKRVEGQRLPKVFCDTCWSDMLGPKSKHGIDDVGNVQGAVMCKTPACPHRGNRHHVTLDKWDGGTIPHL